MRHSGQARRRKKKENTFHVFLVYHLEQFGGDTADDGVGGHILGDYSAGGNDGVIADGNALQDGHVRGL